MLKSYESLGRDMKPYDESIGQAASLKVCKNTTHSPHPKTYL